MRRTEATREKKRDGVNREGERYSRSVYWIEEEGRNRECGYKEEQQEEECGGERRERERVCSWWNSKDIILWKQ